MKGRSWMLKLLIKQELADQPITDALRHQYSRKSAYLNHEKCVRIKIVKAS